MSIDMRFQKLLFTSLFFLCWHSLLAQSTNGKISGLILDPTGGVIAGADLLVIDDVTGVKTSSRTNSDGIYVFPYLPPGPYRLQVSKVGFKTLIKPDIVLNVQDALSINFTLPIGAVSDSVTVEGGAAMVDTTDGSVSTVVDHQFVENMPLNGRSFQTLILLTPGVVAVPTTYSSQGQFSINGQRSDANYLSVDGVSANTGITANLELNQTAGGSIAGFNAQGGTNSLVSVDAMQEFRVQTSSFAPEFGRTPGGQISIVTRSGTNQFHGTAFDYFRNDILDANDWFSNHLGLPKAKERQNDFGCVLGGPLIKDKTFFFFSYEGLRLRQPLTLQLLVPDIPSRQAAPAAVQPFLNAFPLPSANSPSLPGGFAQLNTSYSNPSTLNAYSLRIDHTVNSRLSLFGRYNYSPSDASQRDTLGLSDVATTSFKSHTMTLGLNFAISPRLNNDLRLNYSNVRGGSSSKIENFGGAVPLPDSTMFPSGHSSATSEFALVILGGGSGTLGAGEVASGLIANNEQRQLNAVDSLSLVARAHELKFGVDYRWLSPIADNYSYGQTITFLGVTGPSPSAPPPGYAVSGLAAQATIQANQNLTLLSQNFSFYTQDTWKATPRLTLTYGLRWDINPPLKGKSLVSQPFTVLGLNNPATMTLAPQGTPLFATSYGNLAPRIGAAYQLRQEQAWETVLRGGAGIFYDLGSGDLGDNTFGSWPFQASKTLTNVPLPLTAAQTTPAPFSESPPVGLLGMVTDPNLKLPRTYQWNAAVEQSLGANQTFSATYVGAIGRDLLRTDALFRPNSTFINAVNITKNAATSDYHSLQMKFQRRLSYGLQALASYSWSHSIDIASSDTTFRTAPAQLFNPNADRGNSDFDVRHSVTAALSYDVPFTFESVIARALLKNWAVDSFVIARSALPVNVLGPVFIVSGTRFQSRPNLVPGVPLYLYGPQYPGGKILNNTPNQGGLGCKGPFCAAPSGQQGNFGRNVLRGFGAWQDDFSVRRQFRLRERVALQFRAEFFNVFNHPNFGSPVNTLSNSLFGLSTQTLASNLGSGGSSGGFNPAYQIGGPRSIQLALKLQF
jgi:hypothetical protein